MEEKRPDRNDVGESTFRKIIREEVHDAFCTIRADLRKALRAAALSLEPRDPVLDSLRAPMRGRQSPANFLNNLMSGVQEEQDLQAAIKMSMVTSPRAQAAINMLVSPAMPMKMPRYESPTRPRAPQVRTSHRPRSPRTSHRPACGSPVAPAVLRLD